MLTMDCLANVRIVLSETSHPGNIGAAARAMKTMGLANLHLVNPRRFPDPEAIWRASGATDVLENASVDSSLDAALHGCAYTVACTARTRDVAVSAMYARDAAVRVIEMAHSHRVALVFGNESSGLTTEDVNRCNAVASIPANPHYSSLNLGAAVQVFAYELRIAAAAPPPLAAKPERATHEQVEGFYAHLEHAMAEVGFLDPGHPKKLMPRLRRLFARADLEPDEVNILRGILRAMSHPKKR